MDLQNVLRGHIDSALIRASWVGEVRRLLGLEGASQVWEERPAWYFWLKGVSGVHYLRLEDWGEETAGADPWHVGRFTIRFYPEPTGRAFLGFSREERSLAASGLFDETHTPRAEHAGDIPENLFRIAALEVALNPTERGLAVRLDALSAARELGPAGELVRDVPAWDLAFPVFDLLVGLFGYARRQPPRRASVTRETGFQWVVSEEGHLRCPEASDVALTSASILFGDEDLGLRWRPPASESDVLDIDFGGIEDPPGPSSAGIPVLINPLWWTLPRGDFHCVVTTTCGCTDCRPGPTSGGVPVTGASGLPNTSSPANSGRDALGPFPDAAVGGSDERRSET